MDRTTQPKFEKLSEINLLPISRSILPNGIPLAVINSEEQSIVRIDFLFDGGYWTQEKTLQAYFTNAMLREGSLHYTSSEIAENFDYLGSFLSLSMLPQHSTVTALTLNKYFDQTTDLLNDIIKEPLFPEKELEILRKKELQKYIINGSKVKDIARRHFLHALFGDNHPYGTLTTADDFNNINTDLLLHYFNNSYNSTNCHIFLSGSITDNIIRRVEKKFGTEPFGRVLKKTIFPSHSTQTTSEKRIFIEKNDAKQSAVNLGMILPIDIHHPDYLKLNILITILGGYFGSRLMSNIREDKGYTYGIYSGLVQIADSNILLISTETDNRYVESLIHEVYKEIDRLKQEPVGVDELNMVRNYMIGRLCRKTELSFNMSDVYQYQFINGLEDNYQKIILQSINDITPEDLQEMANKYLCKENLKEVISGKKNE